MAQLSVGTDTTPQELADFFRNLDANDTISGRRGNDGELVLYANPGGRSHRLLPSLEERAVTRVAVEVVLQPLNNILGAELALRHVQSALERPRAVRVGDIAGPLGVLAGLYDGALGNRQNGALTEGASVCFIRNSANGGAQGSQKPIDESDLSEQQIMLLQSLVDKLMALTDPPSSM